MSTDLTPATASPFDALRRTDDRGEFWSARDLMPHLGYEQWRRFEDAIERAKASAANAGHGDDHFAGAGKKVPIGSGAERMVVDYRLSRYGAYLIAMNGDPRKPAIARAQTYFAIKTREAEVRGVATTDTPALPQTYADALRHLLASVEREEQTRAELAAAAPKAQAWDVLADASGDYAVGDAAKILSRDPLIDLGGRRLFDLLEGWGWLYRAGDKNLRAYQRYVDRGWLSELPRTYTHPRTGETALAAPQIRVTAEGLRAIRDRLLSTPALGAA